MEGTHQMMGYDRASTMFSPDGRLLQVEYAKEAVKQGSTAIGVVCKDGVILIADKRVADKLIVAEAVEKIFQVDKHIGATATGYIMDGRILVERAQLIAQQHQVTYSVPIDTITLVKEISDIKQSYTQYGGARPFGVSILFIGVDDEKPVLFATEPTGIFFEYKAAALGEGADAVKELLYKEYSDSMSMEDAIKMCIRALKKVLGKDFDARRIDGAYVDIKEKNYQLIDKKKFRV
ncbi:MAG: proteasome alpha subunit [archaeon GW2011_AR17]|nr:MAG: proteasome alpha subunit [archaeon GW2011_AR17]MBS3154006.1 archaeal proteasome endopeptidase complex subunit alpha [Candidatus Woesearchaeota archaeon]HIH15606.1 archaeal proteasome endopeptidase complex subunit alpha [Nanoarchaeota archaeon]HIH59064.1 archaeal proteasome endopeptidase complex subunit alpha [Nanoarchaeota archaeon]HII14649.1 archaeal proteasome endopeptidase complex subunit alpha [Nanoarchaeota archaeon]